MQSIVKSPVWAEISIDNFIHNINAIKNDLSSNSMLLAIMKADAYGHGAAKLAPIALEAGAAMLGVATLIEAIEIREVCKEAQILVLGATSMNLIKEALKHNITLTIFNKKTASLLSKEARKENKIAKIHIKLDTGMNRLGYKHNDENIKEIIDILNLPNIYVEGVFTHFADADREDSEFTKEQYEAFKIFLESIKIKPKILHCTNSSATLSYKQMHHNMVRPGIIMYGVKPIKSFKIDLKPVMSVKTKITHIKNIQKNESIGYGRTFKSKKKMKIATLPIGYADGYMRALSNKAEVAINGERAPIVGNICMDQCMIDVSHIKNVNIEDEVLIFGKDASNELLASELANYINTIEHEILCAVSKRVKRIYFHNGKCFF